jgi:hypothetical protein
MDSIMTRLAPTLDLMKHDARFFSALKLDSREGVRPLPASPLGTSGDRALDFVDSVMTEERAVAGVPATARSWIERSAFVAVLGVLAVWLAERFSGHTKRVATPTRD